MNIHVLPGDDLVETFRETEIEGEIIVCRECLIEGVIKADSLNEFWRIRENYLTSAYGESRDDVYRDKVKGELEKLLDVSAGDEVNLWFEYELFCQVNFWFCLWLLRDKKARINRVAPVVRSEYDLWKGLGGSDRHDSEKCFSRKIKVSDEDLRLGANLWEAYRDHDLERLKSLSRTASESFPYLARVCQAEIVRRDRPRKRLEEIISEGAADFGAVFQKFSETEGIYGFGDLQVKRLYDEIQS